MPYPEITQITPLPPRGSDPAVFTAGWNTFFSEQPQFITDVNAAGSYVETTAGEVDADATAAAGSATLSENWATSLTEVSGGLKGARGYAQDAEDQATIVSSSANFEGAWSDLTGAYNKGISVYHQGSYWRLINDLADITTSEPGVSADWENTNRRDFYTPISTSQTLVKNVSYAVDFTSGPLTLTLPASPIINDVVYIYRSAASSIDSTIARNGNTIMALAEDLTLDTEILSLGFIFNGSDWRII